MTHMSRLVQHRNSIYPLMNKLSIVNGLYYFLTEEIGLHVRFCLKRRVKCIHIFFLFSHTKRIHCFVRNLLINNILNKRFLPHVSEEKYCYLLGTHYGIITPR